MKPHPWIAALALMVAGVMAFGTNMVLRHREARRLKRQPLPEVEEPERPPPRRLPAPAPSVATPRREPPAPAQAAPTGVLRIRVTGPHGLRLPSVDASAVRQGDDPDQEQHDFQDEPAEDGTLSSEALALGRYDLTVEADGMRPVRVEGVSTNDAPVAITLERAPVLTGAVGRSSEGERGCRYGIVTLEGPGDFLGRGLVDDNDCTFRVEHLPASGPVTVRARGPGRQETTLVTVPLAGDPAFLCFAPPCAARPAGVLIYVADTRGVLVGEAELTWELQADDTHGELGSTGGSIPIYLSGRRPGETLHLGVSAAGGMAQSTVVAGAGVTEVVLTVPTGEEPAGPE